MMLPFVLPVPSNIFREIASVRRQVKAIKQHQHDSAGFIYNAQRADTITEKEIYVLAIGESVRYKNLSLNGEYERKTMPQLEQIENLCLYSNYYANATLTQHALPTLLTSTTAETFAEHFKQKTIAAAFREVGFKTALISHRAQLMNNGYHNYLAQDFDTCLFVEHDSLITPMVRQLADENEKLFIVTHYLGNHMFYTNRTDDCLQWRPDYKADDNVKSDSLFLNAYDNSLLYTDKLLSECIKILEKQDAISVWLFVSDHGEYISSRVSGHGYTYNPTIGEYYVPLMVWYNEKYAAAYPRKIDNLISHKDTPTNADNVFFSVLDMAGISVVDTTSSAISIFGDTLQPHKRTLLLPDGKTVKDI